MTTADMIEAHVRWMRAGGYAEDTTIGDVRKLLHRVNRELPFGLPVATGDELADWLAGDDQTPWSAQTRATYRQHLRRFYMWAVDDQWIDFDPSANLRRPQVPLGIPNPASDEQVAAALHLDQPWRRHAILAAYAGLRCCEIATIDRTDITERRMRVVGKGRKTRIVPTDPYVWEEVEALPPGPVTARPKGGPATPKWVSQRTAEQLRRHDILVTLHRFRAWYATVILEFYKDVRTVQELLGHASPATTAVYTLVSDRQKAAAVAGLPRLAG